MLRYKYRKKGEKTMLWIIFTIWMVFIIICAVMEKKTNNNFYMILFLISIPVMFYAPFMV